VTDSNLRPQLVRFHKGRSSKVRLICCPDAGGSASFFFTFSQLLMPSVEVLAVEYAGIRDTMTGPGIEETANRVFGGLGAWTDRPLALFGHGTGAIVAFQLAKRLELLSNVVPAVLFVSASVAPDPSTGRRLAGREPRLACPIAAFAGDSDPNVLIGAMREWRDCTDGAFDIRVFAGGHYYLVANRTALINEIVDSLIVQSVLGDPEPGDCSGPVIA
jgi:surfactin synthase thioesterase subunit